MTKRMGFTSGTALALALVLMLAGDAAPAAAQRVAQTYEDRWTGEDKVRHLGASAAITAIGYGGARIALDRDASTGAAVGAAAIAGLLRELHDWRLGKPFSVKDLAWDALGIAAGYLWIREIE